jgi:hypothetical protein
MFKGFKLKQMALLANQLVKANNDVFEKFGTRVTVMSKGNHLNVIRINGVENIIAVAWTGSSFMGRVGREKLEHLGTVTLCMNSMYEVAKRLKQDPLYFTEQTIQKFCEDVRSDVYPVVPSVYNRDTYVDVVKAI